MSHTITSVSPSCHQEVTVRLATAADARALRSLAALDSAAPLRGPVLLAELSDEPAAARSLADGRAVADPFLPTAALLAMLELRAAQLGPAGGDRRAGLGERFRAVVRGTRRQPRAS